MKKICNILTISAVLALFCSVSFANTNSSYKLDNASIDAMVDNAVEVSILNAASPLAIHNSTASLSAGSDPWVAFLLSWVVGWCGVHRHYLGTSDHMWALYLFTCGGIFGIVTFVDWVVLLLGAIDDDVSKYANNSKFLMWLN